MNYQRQLVHNAAIGVGVVDGLDDINLIRKPGTAAVIWKRQPLHSFQAWIDGLNPASMPSTRSILRPCAVFDTVSHLCDSADMPAGNHREMLVGDISALADAFAKLMASPYLRLRLDVIENNACSKFHIDVVTARLVCTYRGTGTQYGISTDGQEPKRVFTVPTGAPMILRGVLWPDPPPSGLLHRSPPIEGTGETRLVLVLDPVSDPDNEI